MRVNQDSVSLITVDCWNTLVTDNSSWESGIKTLILANTGISEHPFAYSLISTVMKNEEKHFHSIVAQEHRTVGAEQRLAWIWGQLGLDVKDPALESTALDIQSLILKPLPKLVSGAPSFLRGLRQLRLSTCLICNTGWFTSQAIMSVFKHYELTDLIDAFVFSDTSDWSKPSPHIFAKALQQFNRQPREAVHVGDGMVTDVFGAKNAGLSVVHMSISSAAPARLSRSATSLAEAYKWITGYQLEK